MMHGVVMKITEKCIVVLCEDGTFRNLPHMPDMPQLGDRIPVETPARSAPARKRHDGRWLRQAWWLAASIVLLIGAVFLWKPSTGNASTMVAIDINPSMELYVRQDGRIDRVKPLNDDAKKLLSERELKGQNFYDAVHAIVDEAAKQGFLNAGEGKRWILLSTVELRSAPFVPDKQKVETSENGYDLEWFEADRELMDKAQKAKLSLNKYIVYEKAGEKGIRLNIDDLRSRSVAAALAGAGVDPQRFFDGAGSHAETVQPSAPANAAPEGSKGGQAGTGKGNEVKQPQQTQKHSLQSKDYPADSAEQKDGAARKADAGNSAKSRREDPVKGSSGSSPKETPQSGESKTMPRDEKKADGNPAKENAQGKSGEQAKGGAQAKNGKPAKEEPPADRGVQPNSGKSAANAPEIAPEEHSGKNGPKNK